MKPKTRRLYILLAALAVMAAGLALILTTFRDSLVFFYSPTQIMEAKEKPEGTIRFGGMVKEGSIHKLGEGTTGIRFTVTDYKHELDVEYIGIAPPMFREKQGVVAEGKLEGNLFKAENLLIKHDEKYMPPEVARSLKNEEATL